MVPIAMKRMCFLYLKPDYASPDVFLYIVVYILKAYVLEAICELYE